MDEKKLAIEAIQKKLVGKKLTYKEIYAIMDEIADDRLGDVLTTYFVASGYSKGFSDEEIYFLTKAMIETGEYLDFKGIVADKHSIGGVPGMRATLIIVPIIAAAGFKIPKSSSRAITTPAGTADSMEVISKVTFTKEEIYKIVEKTGACIVWGGSFKIAPADDEIIKIEEPLLFESFDKILVSVMAKKIAFGSNHVVIHLPYGKNVKLKHKEDAEVLQKKFEFLARKFNIKLEVLTSYIDEPAGRGIGPLLETRDALRVLERHHMRPMPLEEMALELASALLQLCLKDESAQKKKEIEEKYENTKKWAHEILYSGQALEKFKEIIEAQKGDPAITSEKLIAGKYSKAIKAEKGGKITEVLCKNITALAKILGAPKHKASGLYLHKRMGDPVAHDEELAILYSDSEYKLNEAFESHNSFPLFKIER